MKNVAEIRKELGTRTIFNLLGPLSNPASPTHQIIGIFSEDFMERYAIAMKMLGIDGMVVHSNGYDELTTTGVNRFIIVKKGKIDEKNSLQKNSVLKRHLRKNSLAEMLMRTLRFLREF
jgi:anthranilate phosphoribosyltransferase